MVVSAASPVMKIKQSVAASVGETKKYCTTQLLVYAELNT